MLTKTGYQKFNICPSSVWFMTHQPHLLDAPGVSDLWRFEQGNAFESLTQQRFPAGSLIPGHGEEAAESTRQAIFEGNRTLFQATAISTDDCLARADILERDSVTGDWSLYEIKSATSVRDNYLNDVAFQWHVFERAGYRLSRAFIIHVDNTFVRHGNISAAEISTIVEVTSEIRDRLPAIAAGVALASAIIDRATPPSPDEVHCQSKPADCPCPAHCYPNLPTFSVFSLPRIQFPVAAQLYRSETAAVSQITNLTGLSPTQQMHVVATRNGVATIDRPAIREFIQRLTWPLSFLDYETVNPPLPLYDGYHPFDHVVFQYSLHTLPSDGAEPQYADFLADGNSDPAPHLAEQLARDIPSEGSVLVWNKSFEKSRNRDLASRCPEYAPFFEQLNERIVDLMDVVQKGYYIDPAFRGRASIKNVLPALVPSLDYSSLDISDGLTASAMWHRLATGTTAENPDTVRSQLTEYCHLDTLALVELFRFFRGL
jgi:hypothetical protein